MKKFNHLAKIKLLKICLSSIKTKVAIRFPTKLIFLLKIGLALKGLIGYLDVRRLVSRILGTWRCCVVVDNISYVQGCAQALVMIHCPHVSTAPLSKGWGV